MWAYLRALLYTMFCDGLRDALFPFFAARDPARRDLGVACPDGGTMRLHFFEPAIARGPLVLLLHGLSGHGTDAYAMELARSEGVTWLLNLDSDELFLPGEGFATSESECSSSGSSGGGGGSRVARVAV